MSRNGRVVVAMSGGVDSSVAACLLKEQGYDCVGVFMRVGVADGPAPAPGTHRHGCCSVTDALDARAIAGRLGVPFYALNFRPTSSGSSRTSSASTAAPARPTRACTATST
jgi:tRNA U34 2-thiouridine synthase MnmA/TrmU